MHDARLVTIIIPTLDNERADRTARIACGYACMPAGVVIIEDTERCGFTRTVNRGLSSVDDRRDVCILVDDCEPSAGWLRELQEAVYERASLPVWFAGPSGPCRTWPQAGGRRGDRRRPRVVPHLAGFCLYVTRDCLEQSGGLDEAFAHYGSDVDWQRRALRDYGAKSLWVPSVYVGHEVHPPHEAWWRKDQQLLQERWR